MSAAVTMSNPVEHRPSGGAPRRSAARLAVIQALYQMELTGVGVETVIEEFSDHRFEKDGEGEFPFEADQAFFRELLRAVTERQTVVDRHIADNLAKGWSLGRLESTARAMLRAATCELLTRPDIPAPAVIDEYVSLAHAFFEDDSPAFVNAALDAIAARIRPAADA